VNGTVNLNGAALQLTAGPNLDADSTTTPPATVYNFLDNNGSASISGAFSNVGIQQTITTPKDAFVLESTDQSSPDDGLSNDLSLLKVNNNNFYVSTTWAGDAAGTPSPRTSPARPRRSSSTPATTPAAPPSARRPRRTSFSRGAPSPLNPSSAPRTRMR
jgi:hypothetical protein